MSLVRVANTICLVHTKIENLVEIETMWRKNWKFVCVGKFWCDEKIGILRKKNFETKQGLNYSRERAACDSDSTRPIPSARKPVRGSQLRPSSAVGSHPTAQPPTLGASTSTRAASASLLYKGERSRRRPCGEQTGPDLSSLLRHLKALRSNRPAPPRPLQPARADSCLSVCSSLLLRLDR